MSRSLGFLLVFLFLVTGCNYLRGFEEDRISNCIEVISKEKNVYDDKNRFYIVLVEGSDRYRQHRDQGVEVVTEAFLRLLEPGDRVAAIWMEVSNLGSDNALFFITEVKKIPDPEILIEPVPSLIPTPTPLTDGITPSSQAQHQNEVENIITSNQKIQDEHICKYVNPIRSENNSKIDEWESSNKSEISRIVNEFSDRVNTSNPDFMSVFEALKLASDIFNEVCANGEYHDCQLIIVSDMVDWRSRLTTPEVADSIRNMNIDFSKVSVSVVWTDCNFFSNQFKTQCETRKETWEKHFDVFNASEEKGNLIFINMNNAVERLEKFIGE